ncbi:MAG TPA: methylated-DNA--[protein]-cysteine S-methyltransferase [Propionibacteriaceae bacterium]|nr:methylated-DNA--[protein]-cysteine S-methyltransferase [Propionibacteriaceae bacterium]
MGTLDDARGRFAERAVASGMVDVRYTTTDSPLGTLLLAATDAGLVRVGFEAQGEDAVVEELASRISPRVMRAPRPLDAVRRELDEYFAGTRRTFTLPLDWQLSHGYRLEVLRELAKVPFGTTESYASLAAATSSPRAVRAVGSACSTNPIPIVVPCHRIVRADGQIGNYLGGRDAKIALLALEGALGPDPAH